MTGFARGQGAPEVRMGVGAQAVNSKGLDLKLGCRRLGGDRAGRAGARSEVLSPRQRVAHLAVSAKGQRDGRCYQRAGAHAVSPR